MKAPVPGRSTGSATIAFGMVSVPVSVYAGIESDAAKIKRKWRTGDGAEVGYLTINKVTGEEITRSEIYDVYECDNGAEVPLDDAEIAKALGAENGTVEVIGFYPAEQASEYVTENLLQVRPQNGKGKARPFDKPFALLMGAMESTDTFALLNFTLRGKPSLGVLDSNGFLRVVRWENEVREARPMPETEVSEAEHGLAVALIETMRGAQAPQIACEAVEKVREYAETKAVSMGTGAPMPVAAADNNEKISDLLGALDASLKAAKKSKGKKVKA